MFLRQRNDRFMRTEKRIKELKDGFSMYMELLEYQKRVRKNRYKNMKRSSIPLTKLRDFIHV